MSCKLDRARLFSEYDGKWSICVKLDRTILAVCSEQQQRCRFYYIYQLVPDTKSFMNETVTGEVLLSDL